MRSPLERLDYSIRANVAQPRRRLPRLTPRYLRQPAYGASYLTGELQFERLMSDYAQQQQGAGNPFNLGKFFARINGAGTIPFALVETETVTSASDRGTPVPDSLPSATLTLGRARSRSMRV